MRKYNPFGIPKKEEFEAVGTEETGIIYLLKRNQLKIKENPKDLQELDRDRARLIRLVGEATNALAKAKGIDAKEANEMLFPKRIGDTDVLPQEDLTQWLSPEDKERWILLNSSVSSKHRAATLFIKYRLGYHVTLTALAKAKTADLEIQPLRWDLAIGQQIQFDGFRCELTEAAEVGDERIYIKPLPQKLEAGATGFVVDFETNSVKIGIPSWSEEDTQDLDEIQVDAIYAFYEAQIGLRRSASEGESQEANSIASSNQSQLTGSSVTPESNGTESPTPNSQSKDLEIVTVS